DIGLILVVKSGQHDCAGGPMFQIMEEKVYQQKETMALKKLSNIFSVEFWINHLLMTDKK
ncbi:MAG: hypothetical protein WBN37_15300, partial [Arenicellales bacterium]